MHPPGRIQPEGRCPAGLCRRPAALLAPLAALITEELAESVRLSNRVTIEIHTGSIAAPRGRTYIAVLADEIAFWGSDSSVNPDAEVIAAIRPGLASIPGSVLLRAFSLCAARHVCGHVPQEWGPR